MKKVLIALVLSVCFVSSAFASEAKEHPEAEDLPVLRIQKEDVQFSREEEVASGIANRINSNGKIDMQSTARSLTGSAISSSINAYFNGKDAKDWMRRTEIGFSFQDNWKPLYSIETIQPIYENELSTVFTQARLSNASDIGTTANLGFGYRKVNKANTSLYGINMFYDHGFKHNHARFGLGLEYFTGYHELHANMYRGLSGEKEVDRGNRIFEKVVDGYDIEYGFTIPKAQWAKIYVQGFSWDYKHSSDANGYKISTQMQLTPQINLEFGYIDESHKKGEKFLKIMYNLADRKVSLLGRKDKNKAIINEETNQEEKSINVINMNDKRLQKVRRQNEIRVERYQKDAEGNIVNTGFNLRISVRA